MPPRTPAADSGSLVRRRALVGVVALVVLAVLAGLAAYLALDDRAASKPPAPRSRSVSSPSSSPSSQPPSGSRGSAGSSVHTRPDRVREGGGGGAVVVRHPLVRTA